MALVFTTRAESAASGRRDRRGRGLPGARGDAQAGVHRDDHRVRPCEPHRHGLCARWAPVRLPADGAVAGHREQPAPADALCVADRQLVGRARAAWRGLRPELHVQPVRVRLLHRDHPTIHNRVSRFTANGNVAVAGSEVVLLDLPTLVGHQPQRRRDALRPRRQALHRRRRQRRSARTHSRSPTRSARCCASTATARSRRTTRSSTRRRGSAARSGRLACATRSRSRSNPRRAGCSSTTSGRTRGKRSTTGSRAPTTGGRPPKGRRPTRPLGRPCTAYPHTAAARVSGLRDHRRRVLRRAARAVPGRVRRRLFLR